VTSTIHPDVVLVYPPYEQPVFRGGVYYTAIPLGVAYMAAALERNGISVSTIDCNVVDAETRAVAERILRYNPRVLGISVTSPSLRYARALIGEVRGRGGSSGIPLIACGGPHVTADPESSRLLGADVCFAGECERGFPDYCRSVADGVTPKPSLIDCGLIADLDSLPHPARHLFDRGRYRFTPVSASRGCPFNCTFCDAASSAYRRRSPENIREEVDALAASGKVKSIDYTDNIFTLDRPFAREIANIMHDTSLPWSCTTRADLVDRQLLTRMADCGCRHISFGVESGVEEIRYAAGKVIPDSRYVKAFRDCGEVGINTRAYAIIGLPGETRETVQRTFDFINALEPDEVTYTPATLYPNSRLMKKAVEEGKVRRDAWTQYMMGEAGMPYYTPEGLAFDEINALIFNESKRFYLNPKKIWSRMRNAQSLDDMADSIKAALAYLVGPLINRQ